MSATEAARSDAPPQRTSRASHVDEADVVRVLTFACVIAVHTVTHVGSPTGSLLGGLIVLLHFTREAFFWLTGFVLTLQYGRRRLDVPHFWRRRFQLVGIPYVLWSLLYCTLSWSHTDGARPTFPGGFVTQILAGTAWYHLYFLLVSLQIYLLFPLIARLIRATARHHVALLGVAGVVQLVLLSWLKWFPPTTGWATFFVDKQSVLVWNYEWWVLAGAVTAWHLDDLRAWATRHRNLLTAGCVVALVVTLGYYRLELAAGESVGYAIVVLQPIMLWWASAMIVALCLLGMRYARSPAGSRIRSVITYASDRSFAVFLVHPMLIWAIMDADDGWVAAHVPVVGRTIGVYVVVVIGSVLVAEVLRRSPLSLVLAGRPMIRRRSRLRARTV